MPLYFSNALRGVIFLFCVFTGILFSERPPVAISCFLRFYLPLCFSNALRGLHLSLHGER